MAERVVVAERKDGTEGNIVEAENITAATEESERDGLSDAATEGEAAPTVDTVLDDVIGIMVKKDDVVLPEFSSGSSCQVSKKRTKKFRSETEHTTTEDKVNVSNDGATREELPPQSVNQRKTLVPLGVNVSDSSLEESPRRRKGAGLVSNDPNIPDDPNMVITDMVLSDDEYNKVNKA